MKRHWMLPTWLCLSLATPPLCAGQPLPDAVRHWLNHQVSEQPQYGFAVAIINTDGIDTFCFGNRFRDGGAVDEQTQFEIGSLSKVYTATLLADAVARGLVAEDDALAVLFPPETRLPQFENRPIRLVDLATHRSGLPRLPTNMNPADATNPYADYTAADLHAFLAAYAPTSAPGQSYAYSNLGFGLLGWALAARQQQPYEGLLQERLLKPLGLTNTTTTPNAAQKSQAARGHGADGAAVPAWDLSVLAGAGGIRAGIGDVAQFVAANLFPERSPLGKVLSATHRQRGDAAEAGLAVGLGWHIDRKGPRPLLLHSGMTGGFQSIAVMDLERRSGVVILANNHTDIAGLAMHLMQPQRFPLADVSQKTTVSAALLKRYQGRYHMQDGPTVTVTGEGDRLFAQLSGQSRFEVFPESANTFYYKVVPAKLEFVTENETVVRLLLHQGGQSLAFARMPDDWDANAFPAEVAVPAATLAQYPGTYESTNPPLHFTVRINENRLEVQLRGQPFFPVFCSAKDAFFYKVVAARIVFEREADQVVGLTLFQNGMTLRAARKP